MGNHQIRVTSISPRMSEVVATEIQKQLDGIKVTRPLHSIILTTWMEIVVAPTTHFVKSGILIGFAT
jgi:hypothetical protein